MSSDRSSEQEKNYDYEVSEPEGGEEQEQKPQQQQKTKNRKRQGGGAPQWVNQPPQGQHMAPYQPPEEDHRDKVMKSRIKDREHSEANDSSLKIKIELDLEAEVNLYARVKGDVTIGLL
jgi:hypothetical protein